jgi:tripartite-type tricarboxylate transporter receptor subunit TctC
LKHRSLIAQKLSQHLGKQFYVENVAGASGNIGTAQAAKAVPDGSTLLVAYSSYAVNPAVFAKITYDPHKDFDPVTLAVTSTNVLAVNPSVPASDNGLNCTAGYEGTLDCPRL